MWEKKERVLCLPLKLLVLVHKLDFFIPLLDLHILSSNLTLFTFFTQTCLERSDRCDAAVGPWIFKSSDFFQDVFVSNNYYLVFYVVLNEDSGLSHCGITDKPPNICWMWVDCLSLPPNAWINPGLKRHKILDLFATTLLFLNESAAADVNSCKN